MTNKIFDNLPKKAAASLNLKRSSSFGSAGSDSSHPGAGSPIKNKNNNNIPNNNSNKPLEPAVLVYHESARDIVFRDQIRRADNYENKYENKFVRNKGFGGRLSRDTSRVSTAESVEDEVDTTAEAAATAAKDNADQKVIIANYQPVIKPLPSLELTQHDTFDQLDKSTNEIEDHEKKSNGGDWSKSEIHAVQLLKDEKAVVKTIKNNEWTSFLHRFKTAKKANKRYADDHADIPSHDDVYRFNSFITSTSLLPSLGQKMRCFGSTKEYTTGVVFALPTSFPPNETEESVAIQTRTWAWPSGYSAKTEFNIDNRGNLINGRQEALVSLNQLRQNNYNYIHKESYEIGGRLVKGGLHVIPYNEVYVRVGGIDNEEQNENENEEVEESKSKPQQHCRASFDKGVGLPIALFVRTSTYGHLISLLRTRARCSSILGTRYMSKIPLLLITPEHGVRVLTDTLQKELLQIVSRNLNPFQNTNIAYKTTINNSSDVHLQQKFEELIDLDSNNIRDILTPEECARLAGGFGATDDSVANLLMETMEQDKEQISTSTTDKTDTTALQDVVNEGLAAAVRSGDYHTSRQLLILYTLVASRSHNQQKQQEQQQSNNNNKSKEETTTATKEENNNNNDNSCPAATKRLSTLDTLVATENETTTLSTQLYSPPPPPPPLDTDRLRSATNSDGLLAVLGAAEVLKSMQDGGAKRRMQEAALAIEEWVEHGEQSVAFRLASWREQRAAQNDLKINMADNSDFLAFVSGKALTNRKNFAKHLRRVVDATNTEDLAFLESIHEIVSQMHSPCLRLELLQYVLGLDNRYSVAHVARSVELAATCMNISAQNVDDSNNGDQASPLAITN